MTTLRQTIAGFSLDTAVDLSRKENRMRLSPSATKGLLRIATHWKLKDEETRDLLGGISRGRLYTLNNRASRALDTDQLTRICLLAGIYKALNILYSPKLADAWMTAPNANPMFAGGSPVTYMRTGGIPAFVRVRQLLDVRRSGR